MNDALKVLGPIAATAVISGAAALVRWLDPVASRRRVVMADFNATKGLTDSEGKPISAAFAEADKQYELLIVEQGSLAGSTKALSTQRSGIVLVALGVVCLGFAAAAAAVEGTTSKTSDWPVRFLIASGVLVLVGFAALLGGVWIDSEMRAKRKKRRSDKSKKNVLEGK